jgi:hypothetical protein
MDKSLMKALGISKYDLDLKIPGTIYNENREVLYFSCENNSDLEALGDLFETIIKSGTGNFMPEGGAITENCTITLPNGYCFYAISYKGDLEGWRKWVLSGATNLGRETAVIDGDKILTSGGDEAILSDCKVRFLGFDEVN